MELSCIMSPPIRNKMRPKAIIPTARPEFLRIVVMSAIGLLQHLVRSTKLHVYNIRPILIKKKRLCPCLLVHDSLEEDVSYVGRPLGAGSHAR